MLFVLQRWSNGLPGRVQGQFGKAVLRCSCPMVVLMPMLRQFFLLGLTGGGNQNGGLAQGAQIHQRGIATPANNDLCMADGTSHGWI